jgi:hypothetical protein
MEIENMLTDKNIQTAKEKIRLFKHKTSLAFDILLDLLKKLVIILHLVEFGKITLNSCLKRGRCGILTGDVTTCPVSISP